MSGKLKEDFSKVKIEFKPEGEPEIKIITRDEIAESTRNNLEMLYHFVDPILKFLENVGREREEISKITIYWKGAFSFFKSFEDLNEWASIERKQKNPSPPSSCAAVYREDLY